MKRLQLIQLLSLSELPESLKLEKVTIHELREQAKQRGIRGFWSLHRDELLELLYPEHKNQHANQDGDKDSHNTEYIR